MALFSSLRHRPFALLWGGQAISSLGDSLYRVALAWWVLEKTGSATAMGTVLVFSITPMVVFLLLGGVAVDRLPRLRLMLGSDLLRALVTGTVAALAFAGRLEIWHVYLASAMFGTVDAVFQPAYVASVRLAARRWPSRSTRPRSWCRRPAYCPSPRRRTSRLRPARTSRATCARAWPPCRPSPGYGSRSRWPRWAT